jgi:hypothetical protein
MTSAPLKGKAATALKEKWLAAWPQAMKAWSPFLRLQEPLWCTSVTKEKKHGLTQSFAMIRLSDHRVVISLRQIKALSLEDYAIEVLAHEVGHHVQYPGSLLEYGRLLSKVNRVLGAHRKYGPFIMNLYTDLLINDRLFRLSKLRMDEIYRLLRDPNNRDPVWNLYLRIYERLWGLPRQTLGTEINEEMELEADFGARIIQIYQTDWIKGGVRFAALFKRHLESYTDNEMTKSSRWLDIHGMDVGDAVPDGLSVEHIDIDDLLHPIDDKHLTGLGVRSKRDSAEEDAKDSNDGKSVGGSGAPDKRLVSPLSPIDYIRLLQEMGVKGDPKDWVVQFYKEQARPYLISFPGKRVDQTTDPLPESLDIWDTGSSVSQIDWMESLYRSPVVIPGVTTVERAYGIGTGGDPEFSPPDVYIGVDCSGSMANPAQRYSYPAVAGTVILLSALRAGSRAMVCLSGEYRSPGSYVETDGFLRNESKLMRVLTDYLGTGSYYGPRHLVHLFLEGKHKHKECHILIVSDSDFFNGIQLLKEGWEKMKAVVECCGAGATAVLNLSEWSVDRNKDYIDKLESIGWDVAIVSTQEELIKFAYEFSKKTYEER